MRGNVIRDAWGKYEIPTWIVAVAIYALWFACVWYHDRIPAWLLFIAGGYVIGWHFSLQHEAVHAFRSVPAWLRTLIVYPPVGLWLPWPLYLKYHSIHHRNTYLTEPGRDTESMYLDPEIWEKLGPVTRAVLTANQTLAGRLFFGPIIRVYRLSKKELGMFAAGDFSHASAWAIHAVLVAVLMWLVTQVAGMPAWKYILLMAYPGFSLGQLRAFAEHRYSPRVGGRTALTESGWFFSLLFLYNNLHAIHHNSPTMPWFRIPRHYRENGDAFREHNENLVFKGYSEVARRWLFSPVYVPVHPIRRASRR